MEKGQMEKGIREATKIVHAGRNPKEQGWMVNPPIYQTSTIVFPTLKDLMYAERGYSNNDLVEPYELKYGRYGTQSNFALEKAIADKEYLAKQKKINVDSLDKLTEISKLDKYLFA